MEKVLKYLSSSTFIFSLLTLTIMFVLLRVIKQILIKKVAYTNKDEQHAKTLSGVVFNVLQYIVIILSVIVVLKINGVDVISILAGLGIMATIIGLSLQDTLKDIFAGINIYSNNFYKVGDVVKYDNKMCEVKYFNARISKFKDLMTNTTYTVCNSMITSIEKIKEDNAYMIRFEPDSDPKKINKAFDKICPELEALYGIRDVIHTDLMFDENSVFCVLIFKANPRQYYVTQSKVYPVCLKYFKQYGVELNFSDDYKVDIRRVK